MIYFLATYVFILGTLIGSFLNVVILRYGTGKKFVGVGERSMCFSCGKTLEWYELLPVFSFVYLRGKCRGCDSKISWQYPLVEVLTGLVFVGIFLKNYSGLIFEGSFLFGSVPLFLLTLLQFLIWSVLIVITVYDFRHKIIPDALVYAFSGLSLLSVFWFPWVIGSYTDPILSGIGFFCFFAGLWFISGGRWLGFGDAKLVLGVGFLLGLVRGLSALVLAFWIGAVVSIALMAWQYVQQRAIRGKGLQGGRPQLTMKSEIPFAPFIILGTLISFFCYVDILGIGAFF